MFLLLRWWGRMTPIIKEWKSSLVSLKIGGPRFQNHSVNITHNGLGVRAVYYSVYYFGTCSCLLPILNLKLFFKPRLGFT